MLTFLMIVLGCVTVLLGLAILLQEPKQAGLSGAFGLGGSEQMLGTSTTSGIARFTMFLAVAFFLLCITVGLMAREDRDDTRLKPDPIEPGFGALEPGVGGVPGSENVGIGDAIGGAEAVIGGDAVNVGDAAGAVNNDTPVVDPPVVDPPVVDPPVVDPPVVDPPVVDPPVVDPPVVDPPADGDPVGDTPVEIPAGGGAANENGGSGN